jgi:hypothetical protein
MRCARMVYVHVCPPRSYVNVVCTFRSGDVVAAQVSARFVVIWAGSSRSVRFEVARGGLPDPGMLNHGRVWVCESTQKSTIKLAQ